MLYFYPKDNTAGCTLEAQGFRDHLADFEALGYAVAGVSRDSVKSHCGFRDRQNLNFPLLADKEEVVCTAYGVMKEKMMYGRLCRGHRTLHVRDLARRQDPSCALRRQGEDPR